MSERATLERVLSRDRWVVGACLALACALAWLWLFRTASEMTAPAGMTGMSGMGAPAPGSAAYFAGAVLMWFLMMTAMMLPSAAPMILLYARVARGVKQQGGALTSTLIFAGVYLALWASFSVAAAGVQAILARVGLLSAMTLQLGDGRISGGLLILAGVYQLTPLKRACLASCRAPMTFLMRLWRPGLAGATRLGFIHGLYCIGCCWALMALLFAGGVMSLPWVALLALIVLGEKLVPIGRIGVWALGGLCLVAGAGLILMPLA